MKPFLKVLKILAGVVVLLVIAGAGGGYWFVTKSFPQVSGSIRVPGLKAQVEVIRDPMGIPHIYASNVDDLFFAQGYVQAQDRLWQMELYRSIGQGRTAELSGPSGVEDDRFLRTIGLGQAAQADWEATSGPGRAVLEAYAAGVNAYIQSHGDNLPIEFTLLGRKPEPWQPVHTLGWGKVMALDLGRNRTAELLRARLLETLGREKLNQIWLPYPASGPFIIPPEAKSYVWNAGPPTPDTPLLPLGNPDLAAMLARDAALGGGEGIGSNDWVVDGTKSTTGKPLLANDPHLGIQLPSIWYTMGLHCQPVNADCPFDVVGVSFPASPGIILGHNGQIAWGVTNTGPDVQDYYIEKVNPQNPNQYEYQGKWEEFKSRQETLHVRGAPDESLEVKTSRHGPVMTPVLEGITQTLALQWTATRERSSLYDAVLGIDAARNWDEFRAALKSWDVPSQNFVYADVDGNIGYQLPGRIPIRPKGDGSVPVPGWTGEYEWTGYIPFDELPMVYNPPTHFIATANNQVVPNSYKYLITTDWSPPNRAARITQLLQSKEKLSPDDFAAIQGDVSSDSMLRLRQYIVGFTFDKDQFLPTRAMEWVTKFDGRLAADSYGAAILEVTYQQLVKNIFANKLSADLFQAYQAAGDLTRPAVMRLLEDPNNTWWDDPATPQQETRDDILKKSYIQAVDYLGSQFGDAPIEWRWGRIHAATFAHPFGSIQPLNLLFNVGPLAVPGDGFTVFNTGFSDGKGFAERTVPSMRLIQDVGNWNQTRHIHTTGESGQPLNKHYADMVNPWRDVSYVSLAFDRAAVLKSAEGTLVMTP